MSTAFDAYRDSPDTGAENASNAGALSLKMQPPILETTANHQGFVLARRGRDTAEARLKSGVCRTRCTRVFARSAGSRVGARGAREGAAQLRVHGSGPGATGAQGAGTAPENKAPNPAMESSLQMLALPDGCDAEQQDKWQASLVAGSDGAMYAPPVNAAGVLRVDPVTRTTSLLALPDGCDAKQQRKWRASLVAGSDGAMYAAPLNAAGVLRVDPVTRTTSLLALPDGCDAKQRGKWR
eukprot:COSAG02_NODE_6560_length_3494_cov_53.005302_1_plen_238_part_10